MKMHRTKCSAVINNVLSRHFKQLLIQDIGSSPYSILVDEATDISMTKELGVCIMYFSQSAKKVVSTYLQLSVLEGGDAKCIVSAVKATLADFKLDLQKLRGICTDKASVMTGRENGVYALLKKDIKHLILITCTCHSLQLAVSAACKSALPKHLEFLVSETYNWFSKSSKRQIYYKELYRTLNEGTDPLKIVRACDTRWLSVEVAVARILAQWEELRLHFEMCRQNEECYVADTLFNMYKDPQNKILLQFVHPLLKEAQHINKSFQSSEADPAKLLKDLVLLVEGTARMVATTGCRADLLQEDVRNYLHPKPYLGHVFEEAVRASRQTNAMSVETEMGIRQVCVNFVVQLVAQYRQRLPENVRILQQIALISPDNCLRANKQPITPLAQLMGISASTIVQIEFQWKKINLVDWEHKLSTVDFWVEVMNYKDASGECPFRELCELACLLLVLPWGNADVERTFSIMKVVKTPHRNRMQIEMLNAILTIRSGLRRMSKCCNDYELPSAVLREIGTMAAYVQTSSATSTSNVQEEVGNIFHGEDSDVDPDEPPEIS